MWWIISKTLVECQYECDVKIQTPEKSNAGRHFHVPFDHLWLQALAYCFRIYSCSRLVLSCDYHDFESVRTQR